MPGCRRLQSTIIVFLSVFVMLTARWPASVVFPSPATALVMRIDWARLPKKLRAKMTPHLIDRFHERVGRCGVR